MIRAEKRVYKQMNKASWRPYGLHLAWQCVWLIPVPFGAFVSDKGFFTTLSFLMFSLGSLIVPLLQRQRQVRRRGDTLYASPGMYFYGALTGIMLVTGFFDSLIGTSLWQNYYSRIFLYACWMVATIIVQNLLAWGFDFWKKRRRKYEYSEFLDPVLYALPIPISFMTMCFFPVLDTKNLDGPLIGLFILLGLCVFLLIAFVLASFALYFYPAKERFPKTSDRIVQLIRILCMSLAWLALNMPASPYIRFVVSHTPLSENNILTMIIPFIGEAVSIVAAVACSNLIPLVWKWLHKGRA